MGIHVLRVMMMEYGRLWAQRKLRGWSQEDVVRRLIDVGIELESVNSVSPAAKSAAGRCHPQPSQPLGARGDPPSGSLSEAAVSGLPTPC